MHSPLSLAFLGTLLLVGSGQAADVDFAKGTEATAGNHRVVLLSVTKFSEFTSEPAGKARTVQSVRVTYLVEDLGTGTVTVPSGGEVLAAGKADKAFKRVGAAGTPPSMLNSTENFTAYEKRVVRQGSEWTADRAKLPNVKNADRAVVVGLTWYDVEVTAKSADVKMKVGGDKGESIVFKNVPLE